MPLALFGTCYYTWGAWIQETQVPPIFGVIDLFAGPGGLGEGFASCVENGHRPFHIGISVEKEKSAHRTLRLRAFLRDYYMRHGHLPKEFIAFHGGLTPEPIWEDVDEHSWRRACIEARELELGTTAAAHAIDEKIRELGKQYDDTILIGGPPCQAYSLVGRARSRGQVGYVPEKDERHFLFREYIEVLKKLRPAVFVMENVKGMLSSTVAGRRVFEMLMEDLSSLGTWRNHLYDMRAIRVDNGTVTLQEAVKPADFVVRAEDFGVPQRRHRVIIIGVRADLSGRWNNTKIESTDAARTVQDAIGNMPALRSGISREADSPARWCQLIADMAARLVTLTRQNCQRDLSAAFREIASTIRDKSSSGRSSSRLPEAYGKAEDSLKKWLERPEVTSLAQHETRSHMASDLQRYLFASTFARVREISPKAMDFPVELSPDHRNWSSGVFSDRFRVQLGGEAATTITSHISKDGHYFIHPDPHQCRSLTVREAARLQTFPDDYFFMGNRTQQYVQVGNAVPPYLARKISQILFRGLAGASEEPDASSRKTFTTLVSS